MPRIFFARGFWRMVSDDGQTMAAAPTIRALSDYVTHPWYRERWA